MKGIWVAVKATTVVSGSSRYTTLKSWKSRPAAPMIRTRLPISVLPLTCGAGGRRAQERERAYGRELRASKTGVSSQEREGPLGQQLAPAGRSGKNHDRPRRPGVGEVAQVLGESLGRSRPGQVVGHALGPPGRQQPRRLGFGLAHQHDAGPRRFGLAPRPV